MKLNSEKLIQALKKGIVSLRFKSLSTGRRSTIPVTLSPQYIPAHFSINQSADSDTIVMYRLDFKAWEDIQVTSIISWDGQDGV